MASELKWTALRHRMLREVVSRKGMSRIMHLGGVWNVRSLSGMPTTSEKRALSSLDGTGALTTDRFGNTVLTYVGLDLLTLWDSVHSDTAKEAKNDE